MAKDGYKHKTSVPGTDAEYYVMRLLMMLKNPNGGNRPDFITPDGLYSPRFSIELKSGKGRKVVLNEDQFQYIFTAQDDYHIGWRDTFFEDQYSSGEKELLEKVMCYGKEEVELDVPLYYAAIARDDKLMAKDLDRPFSSIRFNWGDIYVVPSEMAFHMFSINRAFREKDVRANLQDVKKAEEKMRTSIVAQLTGSYDYRGARTDSNFWQSLSLRSLESFFAKDRDLAFRDKGKMKYDMLQEIYPQIEDFGRLRINGNRDSSINMLFKPEHKNLFENQLSSVISQRLKPLEKIIEERERSRDLLNYLTLTYREGLFQTTIPDEVPTQFKHQILNDISQEDMVKLNRLTRWLAPGEKEVKQQLAEYEGRQSEEVFMPEELVRHPLEDFVDDSVPF